MSLTILGTGSALPKGRVTNTDLTAFLDTSDEWIRTRTGIAQRHILGSQTLTEIAVQAAQNALANAGIAASELDYILCPTLGGETLTPSLACMVQAALGASCPALDINGACSGFLYGLDIAAAILARGGARHVLLLAAEALSHVADWTDRSTCVLFGDGAGAAVLAPGEDLLYSHLTSQGNNQWLYAPFAKGNFPGTPKSPLMAIHMDGGEVYKFAVGAITANITQALAQTGIAPQDVACVLLHQANLRIIDAARKKLDIPPERYAVNIHEVGNMSAASIPVLMDACNRAGQFNPGDILVLSGFGGGLTTGTAVIRWRGQPA